MAERSVCPHCSFRNFSVSKLCARCEKPLAPAENKPGGKEPAFAPPAPAAAAPPAARSAKERAQWMSRRTTAPLAQPPPAAPRARLAQGAPKAAGSPAMKRKPVSMAEGPRASPFAAPTVPPAAPPTPAPDDAEAATRIGIPLPSFPPAPAAAPEPVFAEGPSPPPEAPSPSAPGKKRRTSKPLVAARLWQHALAAALDVLAIVAVGALWGGFEMLLKGGSWPTGPATFFESLAMWLHIYARTTKRMVALMIAFSLGHTVYGVRTGKTFGRLVCGLLLVGMASGKPTKGGTWGATLWHATGGILSVFTLGAGHFWMLVDSQRRTWANVLGRTLVVQNAKRQGAARL